MPIEPEDPGVPSRAERLLYLYLSVEPDFRTLSLRRAARASLHALLRFKAPRQQQSAHGAVAFPALAERRTHPDRRARPRLAADRRRRVRGRHEH